jgi:lactoylglutathione lyase
MKKIDYTIVFVSDMKRSVEFYRDVLGLPLKFESPDWTEFATEGTTLALHGKSKPAEHAAEEHARAGTCQPGFQVAGIDGFHQKMLAKGVRCVQPPKAEQFGTLAVYADPDGLAISIWEAAQHSHHG